MKEEFSELPEDHWFRTAERIKERFRGEKPSPMQIRAAVILELTGIPSGQYSTLKTQDSETDEAVRTDKEGDKIVAENITNKAGLFIEGSKGITSRDLRDRYPDGIPDEVLNRLDPELQRIIKTMYEYEEYAKKPEPIVPGTEGVGAANPVNLHFLPGGIPYVSVGCTHTKGWMNYYSRFLKEIGKDAEVVAIEGYFNRPVGKTLNLVWEKEDDDTGYGTTIKNLAREGYDGYFTEVDGRDESRVSVDTKIAFLSGDFYFPNLPDSFYEKYLEYLKKEDPKFGESAGTPEKLKSFSKKQSPTEFSRAENIKYAERNKKMYAERMSFTDTGEASTAFTGNELGGTIYSDALAAVKLHLIGRMMNDGAIPKGAIVDYEGHLHQSSKSFFLQNPEYAMEIVLRTLPNLLAGSAEKSFFNYLTAKNFAEKIFDNPDWERVIREIFRIPFKKVAAPRPGADSVEIGENQRPMTEAFPDDYVLKKILASQKEGKREVKDWVKEMESLIKKFATEK
jgi:hypothetical protein